MGEDQCRDGEFCCGKVAHGGEKPSDELEEGEEGDVDEAGLGEEEDGEEVFEDNGSVERQQVA